MYLFHDGPVSVDTYLAPTQKLLPGDGFRYAISFDDETPNRYPDNTRRLWRELWQTEIDIRQDIIAPALARRAQGYGEPPPDYKRALREV